MTELSFLGEVSTVLTIYERTIEICVQFILLYLLPVMLCAYVNSHSHVRQIRIGGQK